MCECVCAYQGGAKRRLDPPLSLLSHMLTQRTRLKHWGSSLIFFRLA